MRPLFYALLVLGLAGCAAHEVYERPGLQEGDAKSDWAQCEIAALEATGWTADRAGSASVRGDRLLGEVVDPEPRSTAGMSGADYAKVEKRRQLRQQCLQRKGYRYLGVPAVERL